MKPFTVILLGDEGYLQAIRVVAEDQGLAVIKARQLSLDDYIAENFPAKGEEMDTVIDEWEGFYADFLIIDGHPGVDLLQEETRFSFRFLGELHVG